MIYLKNEFCIYLSISVAFKLKSCIIRVKKKGVVFDMKFCTHCGAELLDDDLFCPNCGCKADESSDADQANNQNVNNGNPNVNYGNPNGGNYNSPYTGYNQPADNTSDVLSLIAKILLIINCVCSAIAIIPLCWKIPMTVHYWKAVGNNQKVGTGFKVCTLLFVDIISGILMLCDSKH